MAKLLNPNPVTKADLVEFLNTQSDFAFELSVIPILSSYGFIVEHGGTYSDPVTGINRQFDVRAEKRWALESFGNTLTLSFSMRLAVECKNLRPNFPLLISCIPRATAEAFTSIVMSDTEAHALATRLIGHATEYRFGEPVGKATDQVGRTADKANQLTNNDSEVYDKWSQAIASSADLIIRAGLGVPLDGTEVLCSCVYPMLIVPDGTLWTCQYRNGKLDEEPAAVNRCSFFIGKEWPVDLKAQPFNISHMEVMTTTGLKDWLKNNAVFNSQSSFGLACYDAAKSRQKSNEIVVSII